MYTNGDLANTIRDLASSVQSLLNTLRGFDPHAVVVPGSIYGRGPRVNPIVFAACGDEDFTPGVEVIHYLQGLEKIARWLEDLREPIAELDPTAAVGTPGSDVTS
jgi:hypothetical protein